MKAILILIGVLTAGLANAKEVEITCATKAYTCTTGVCGWVPTTTPTTTLVQLYRDPNYPKDGSPYELWRATYQVSYDQHLLTLVMEAKDDGTSTPVTVFATLGTGRVFAEATGLNQISIGLRNHNYGRGFTCTSIRAID